MNFQKAFGMLGLSVTMLFAGGVVAQEDMGPEEESTGEVEEVKASNYELCQKYRADIDADLGEVLRAGCEPTLAQMSALMDNPIGKTQQDAERSARTPAEPTNRRLGPRSGVSAR